MKTILFVQTDLGPVGIAEENGAVTDLFFQGEAAPAAVAGETPLLREAARQIEEYLAGERTRFELPLAPAGTPFQKRVWEALQAIPYGETRSYQAVAESIGQPKACRAVGLANNRNPISIVIPCHRVIGKDGSLVGYGGGLAIKERLLRMEADHAG